MNGPQVDLFSAIHKGLRNLITQFSLRAGALAARVRQARG